MNPLAWGLAKIHEGLVDARNRLYDDELLPMVRLPYPVISLGNLTIGGTGKTPLTDFCLSLLCEKGHRPGLVCRSYRASLRGPARVQAQQTNAPGMYGDEATWLARRHPEVPVWSGPVKSDTARTLVEKEKVDVVLLDDGYQHRRLHRDLNLLLLDAMDPLPAYELFPLGRAREGLISAERADAFLFTKVNWAGGVPPQVREKLPNNRGVFEFDFNLAPVNSPGPVVFLVSAVARPEAFADLVRRQHPESRIEQAVFRDHHVYSAKDVESLVSRAQELAVKQVLTTEKDEVKLRPLWPSDGPTLNALPLEVRLESSIESFYEVLARVFRPHV